MELYCHQDQSLPALGWIAFVDVTQNKTEVVCGRHVEFGDNFVVEGVWDGAFSDMEFIQSHSFFGSGLTVTAEGVQFSPSRGLVDRLLSCQANKGPIVSNSLMLLLATTEGRLDSEHSYEHETYTLADGIIDYVGDYNVQSNKAAQFRQHFYHPFQFSSSGTTELPVAEFPEFKNFEHYASTLNAITSKIIENANAAERKKELLPKMTVSAGYDSTAVASIVKSVCEPTVYTSKRSNASIPEWLNRRISIDDGEPIATALGLKTKHLHTDFSRFDERVYLSTGTASAETIFDSMANDVYAENKPSLLFSGYHGDAVWSRTGNAQDLAPTIRRKDVSGTPLCELRLQAGFVHLPVPFIGAIQRQSIHRIANSAEMAPWQIGGDYDRPIPRRLAEEAGVPRQLFGQRKRAVVDLYAIPKSKTQHASFDQWLQGTKNITLKSYHRKIKFSHVWWLFGRATEVIGEKLGLNPKTPDMWRFIPNISPGSALHHWAVDSILNDNASPYNSKNGKALMDQWSE